MLGQVGGGWALEIASFFGPCEMASSRKASAIWGYSYQGWQKRFGMAFGVVRDGRKYMAKLSQMGWLKFNMAFLVDRNEKKYLP